MVDAVKFGQKLGQLFGMGGPRTFNPDVSAQPVGYGDIQAQMMRAQQDMALADALSNQGYIPDSGWAGVAAQWLGALQGKRVRRDANESVADALKRQFELDNKTAAEQAAKAAKDEQEKYDRDLGRRRAEKSDPVLNPATNQRKYVNGVWVDPVSGTTEIDQKYFDAQSALRAAGRTNVTLNANGAPPTGFEKALDKKDADYYDSLRGAATSAAQTLDRLGVIKEVMGRAKTGRIPEALAIAGQLVGSDAAKDMQTFNAASQPLFLAMAEQMKGALSDKDREALQQAIPRFGNDPRANDVVVGLLEKAAKQSQATFASADEFAQKNRGLRGWTPPQAVNVNSPTVGQYQIGQVIELNGKKYRVTGGPPDDPDVEEIR